MMLHAKRPGGPVAAVQNCATYDPLSIWHGVEDVRRGALCGGRLAVVEEGLSHYEAGRRFGIDRRTVKKMLSYSSPPGYRRSKPVRRPKLDGFTGIVDAILGRTRSGGAAHAAPHGVSHLRATSMPCAICRPFPSRPASMCRAGSPRPPWCDTVSWTTRRRRFSMGSPYSPAASGRPRQQAGQRIAPDRRRAAPGGAWRRAGRASANRPAVCGNG